METSERFQPVPQFNLTPEDETLTRADLYHIGEIHKGDIFGFIKELEELGFSQEAIDKVLSDLASY